MIQDALEYGQARWGVSNSSRASALGKPRTLTYRPPPSRSSFAGRPARAGRACLQTAADDGSRNSDSPASACCIEGARHQTGAHRCGYPDQPGLAVAPVRLARLPDDCSSRNRHLLAPRRLASVLAPQDALRSAPNSLGAPSAHPAHGLRLDRARMSRSPIEADQRQTRKAVPGSRKVEAIKAHDLVPGRDEVVDELLLGVGAAINFSHGPELGV